MTSKAELIVLYHTKFRENSIVLHTLSEEYGRRGYLVRVGPKASMAFFLPLNILEAEISENPKSDLWHARNFACRAPLNGIRGNLHKNAMSLFMSEVLYRVVRDQTDGEGVANWLKKEILTLDALESDFSNFHLMFLLELCGALGFSPDQQRLAPFADTCLAQIESLLTLPFSDAMIFPLNGKERNTIAESVLKYIGYHTESAVHIRSLAVLRDLYR